MFKDPNLPSPRASADKQHPPPTPDRARGVNVTTVNVGNTNMPRTPTSASHQQFLSNSPNSSASSSSSQTFHQEATEEFAQAAIMLESGIPMATYQHQKSVKFVDDMIDMCSQLKYTSQNLHNQNMHRYIIQEELPKYHMLVEEGQTKVAELISLKDKYAALFQPNNHTAADEADMEEEDDGQPNNAADDAVVDGNK